MTRADRFRRLMEAQAILDRGHKMRRLRFNAGQEQIWAEWEAAINATGRLWTIVLKARKVGISTLTQALIFTYGFWIGNGESLTLAHEGESAKTIFEMQRRMFTSLPITKPKEPPRHEIRMPTKAGYVVHRVATAGAEAKGRGGSPFALHCSEAAFWPYAETMLSLRNSMPLPHVPSLFVEESTANGKSGRGQTFYEDWQMAGDRGSTMIRVFLPWFVLPEYRLPEMEVEDPDDDEREMVERYGVDAEQLAYYRFILTDQCHGDPMLRRQEYPWDAEVAFVASGMPAFDPRVLARQRVNCRVPDAVFTVLQDGKLLRRPDGELKIWKHPDGRWPGKGRRYVCAVDSAPGGVFDDAVDVGDTRSWTACTFIDADTGAQVGEWYGPLVGRLFAPTLHVLVSQVFPESLCAIELNSEGGRTCQADLREIYKYHKLHPWKGKRDRVKKTAPHVYGWETNPYTRPMILDNAQYLLAKDAVTIRSERLLDQLGALTNSDTGRYEAEVGRDDLALAWMIGLESWQENFKGKQMYVEPENERLEQALNRMGIHYKPAADRALEEHLRKVRGRV